MTSSYVYYLVAIIGFILIFIIIAHKISHYKKNDNLQINQAEHPDSNVITLLINKKLPTIFIDELSLWEGIDLMIGLEYNEIKNLLKNKKINDIIKTYLKPFTLPFTISWNISLKKNTTTWETLPNKPIYQNNINSYIASLSGLCMIILFNPSKDNTTIISKDKNIKQLLENEHNTETIDYITIPLRLANMIYIPYGWWYYIYNGSNENSYCTYLELNNKLYI